MKKFNQHDKLISNPSNTEQSAEGYKIKNEISPIFPI